MAKKKKYIWTIGGELPTIDEHSKVKLDIIAGYMSVYLETYFQHFNSRNLKLTIVDGFAGGGLYKCGTTGSPIRILETIKQTKDVVAYRRAEQNMPTEKLNIDYFFVEKCKEAFAFLSKILNDYGYSENNIFAINDEFENSLEKIINHIQARKGGERSIFVLDQYGYMDATLATVKKILSTLQNAEVILTFSTDTLIDYLSEKQRPTLKKLGFSDKEIDFVLDEKKDTTEVRARIQPILYRMVVNNVGAKFYTPFFIKSDVSNRSYWLFHFSTVPIARDKMSKLHWDFHNTSAHYGAPGTKMLGYNYEYEEKLFGDTFLFDESAKEKSIMALSSELPDLIAKKPNYLFGHLITDVINETPATIEMIKTSLNEHVLNGDILVRTKNGSYREKASTIQEGDLLQLNKQQRFKF